eukprot:g18844.t1
MWMQGWSLAASWPCGSNIRSWRERRRYLLGGSWPVKKVMSLELLLKDQRSFRRVRPRAPARPLCNVGSLRL